MNENLNLIEILKDAEGTKLYSSLCGDCRFIGIEDSSPLCVVFKDCHDRNWRVYPNGRVTRDGECVVFPSRENHDWSTFKTIKKHKEFKPFQKVLINKHNSNHMWVAGLYSHYDAINNIHFIIGAECAWWAEDSEIISYEENEDKLGKTVE